MACSPLGAFGYRIQAVLFDFDGTLTAPGALDFAHIRKTLGCPDQVPVLEYIDSLVGEARRRQARQALDRFETQGAAASRPNEGAERLVRWLKAQGLIVGILTRNNRASVVRALENFIALQPDDFELIITRDDPVAPKPAGDGVHYAARHLGVDLREVLVVGDFIFDMQAGREAGAWTVLLDPLDDPKLAGVECDRRIRQLEELRPIVQAGLPLSSGDR